MPRRGASVLVTEELLEAAPEALRERIAYEGPPVSSESGLSPAAALQASTINNARSLKQEDKLGSIAPSKLADLVILTADPTADIRNTRKIDRVIRGGRVCDPQVLLKAVPR